ncbi:FAD binding domain-containing protein [Promicromonospora sp. MS192]|uniref:FAD binding domain-containing protein n=1 Tax=Promicromonospora sp. MS192 TaxID=3412684 RepID=UPI003C2B8A09
MDLDVDTVRVAWSRADCVLRPGETFLGGGTYLYSEPVPPGVTGLVDLTGLGWEPWSVDGSGLRVAGTCTLEELLAGPGGLGVPGPYRALGIVAPCVAALTLSAKVARTATVGGNLALGLPAGSMAGLFAALAARAVVWTPDGGTREVPVADLVTGAGVVALSRGEVLREVLVPEAVLRQRTAVRRASLTPTGRTAAMVTGRAGEDGAWITLTGSVGRPLGRAVRDHAALDRWIDTIDLAAPTAPTALPAPTDSGVPDGLAGGGGWYEDTHGSRAWRAAMTRRLAHEVLDDLGDPT